MPTASLKGTRMALPPEIPALAYWVGDFADIRDHIRKYGSWEPGEIWFPESGDADCEHWIPRLPQRMPKRHAVSLFERWETDAREAELAVLATAEAARVAEEKRAAKERAEAEERAKKEAEERARLVAEEHERRIIERRLARAAERAKKTDELTARRDELQAERQKKADELRVARRVRMLANAAKRDAKLAAQQQKARNIEVARLEEMARVAFQRSAEEAIKRAELKRIQEELEDRAEQQRQEEYRRKRAEEKAAAAQAWQSEQERQARAYWNDIFPSFHDRPLVRVRIVKQCTVHGVRPAHFEDVGSYCLVPQPVADSMQRGGWATISIHQPSGRRTT